MHLKIVIILFFFLAFSSCKEDKKIEQSYCTQNPGGCQSILEAKKFFAFKLGTWWVYEEETSKVRDSVYVTDSYISETTYDFDIRTHSTLSDYNYHYWPFYTNAQGCNLTLPLPKNKKCLYVNRSKGKQGEFVGQDYCFFVNYSIGSFETVTGNIFFDNNKIIIDSIYDSLTLSVSTFGKTVKINEFSTRVEGIQPTNHYFSVGIGLVRKELLDSNQVWNLVNYHIEL
jgi:hypothetical protein